MPSDVDPLAEAAPRMLAHLRDAHAEQLLEMIRAHVDPTIEIVEPRSLDSHALSMAVISATGASEVTLTFPGGPVGSAREAAEQIRAALRCPCRVRPADRNGGAQ